MCCKILFCTLHSDIILTASSSELAPSSPIFGFGFLHILSGITSGSASVFKYSMTNLCSSFCESSSCVLNLLCPFDLSSIAYFVYPSIWDYMAQCLILIFLEFAKSSMWIHFLFSFVRKQVCANNVAAFQCNFLFNIFLILWMICLHWIVP